MALSRVINSILALQFGASHLILLLLFNFVGPLQAAPGNSQSVDCGPSATETSNHTLVSVAENQIFSIRGSHGAWLEVEEAGQNLDVAASPLVPAAVVTVPPRYGWRIFEASRDFELAVHRREPDAALGSVRLHLDCLGGASTAARFAWMKAAETVSTKLSAGVKFDDVNALVSDAEHLVDRAPTPKMRALGLHLVAQSLLMGGRSAAASKAFAVAEAGWNKVGEPERALAARVGRVEDLRRAGKYDQVLALVPQPSRTLDAHSYFAVRLVNSRCLTLRDLGRPVEAADCYEWTLAHLRALDERIEYVNTLQNYAVLQMEQSRSQRAEDLARKALSLAAGPNADIVRGRIHLLLLEISLSKADVARAVSEGNEAVDAFTAARSPRWEANALLEVAVIYRELGAYTEAYDSVAQALRLLSPADAPARIASALAVLGSIDGQAHRRSEALQWLKEAVRIHEALKMHADIESDKLATARLQLEIGDGRAAVSTMLSLQSSAKVNAEERALVSAEVALYEHKPHAADANIRSLDIRRLTLSQRIELTRLRARIDDLRGEPELADRTLEQMKAGIASLALNARNPLLRRLIINRAGSLEQMAFERILANSKGNAGFGDVDTELVWSWLVSPLTVGILPDSTATTDGTQAASFDQAVAAAVLAPAISDFRSSKKPLPQRELFAFLGKDYRQRESGPLPEPDLQGLRSTLPPDTLLVAYVHGDDIGALFLVSRAAATIIPSMPPSELRTVANALRAAVSSRTSRPADIMAAADRLSERLLAGLRGTTPPRKLLVLADDALDSIPWSVLRWPGSPSSLLETSTISLVRLVPTAAPTEKSGTDMLRVFVASQQFSREPSLPPLEIADAEPAQIRQAVPGRRTVVKRGRAATRDQVLDALDEPGIWVHIAAHGWAEPNRLGYAGVWLDPSEQGAGPTFLSWLDVLQRGASADLVVLNACQLADGGDALDGNLSFAGAVSEAGARQVVAALWPVSDAATSIWVPAFYTALVADPHHDAAAAVRAAQIRLRTSRMFRHPFYWAGLQTFTHR